MGLKIKEGEISAHRKGKPKEIKKPNANNDGNSEKRNEKLLQLETTLSDLESKIHATSNEQIKLTFEVEKFNQAKQDMVRLSLSGDRLKTQYAQIFSKEKIDFDKIFSVSLNLKSLDDKIEEKNKRLSVLSSLLFSESDVDEIDAGDVEKNRLKKVIVSIML